MANDYLDFEEPIAVLERKIQDLRSSEEIDKGKLSEEISKLNNSIIKLTEKIFSNLSAWQCVQMARHPLRPHFSDFIEKSANFSQPTNSGCSACSPRKTMGTLSPHSAQQHTAASHSPAAGPRMGP